MARSKPHAIVRNRKEIVAQFASYTLADEAYYDLGCYLDAPPALDDVFEVMPLSDALNAIEKNQIVPASEQQLFEGLAAAQRALKVAKTPKERAAAQRLIKAVEDALMPFALAAQAKYLDPNDAA